MEALVYRGRAVRERGRLLSLTDMWKASGEHPSKAPAQWLRSDIAREFVDFVANLQHAKSHNDVLIVERGGRSPGTWADWHVGLAYAKYLSPAFHVWCNEVVRAHMEGRSTAAMPQMLGEVHKQLAELATEVRDLRARLADGGVIGEDNARVFIKGPLQRVVQLQLASNASPSEKSSVRTRAHNDLRAHLGFFGSGRGWAMLDKRLLAVARVKLAEMLRTAQQHHDRLLADARKVSALKQLTMEFANAS